MIAADTEEFAKNGLKIALWPLFVVSQQLSQEQKGKNKTKRLN